MKRILRSSLSSLIYYGAQCLGREEAGVRILSYHRVNDQVKNYITVSVDEFKNQMRFLAKQRYRMISLCDFVEGRAGPRSVVITFDDGYGDNYEQAFPILRGFGFTATIFCIAKAIGHEGYLTKENILEMHAAGFEFGSHTLSHPHLPQISSVDKWQEIDGSKRLLEETLGFPVDFFCYPYGEWEPESVDLVAKAGFRGACTNLPGANEKMDPFFLRRTEIGAPDTAGDFKKKMAGAFDWLHQGLHWVRGRP